MQIRPTLVALLVGSLVLGGGAVQAADKAALKCRKALAKKGVAITKGALQALDACHGKRDAGRSSSDCNTVNPSSGALAQIVRKSCGGAPAIVALFAGNDPATAITAAVKEAVEESGRTVQGSPSLAGDKAKAKCHKTIGLWRSKITLAVAQAGTRCQNARDKNAPVLGEMAAECAVGAGAVGSKAPGKISGACAGIAGGDVGSCASLPGCVVDAATETGHTLAARYYASHAEPVCHDGHVDAELGEECDEGLFDTDTCVDCKIAGCGDGRVASGEQCDDGNTTAGDGCDASCQVEGTPVTVVIALTHDPALTGEVSGVEITVDYPTAKVSIPGSGNVPASGGRVANLGPPDVLFDVSDRDGNSDGTDDQLFIPYGTTGNLPKGDLVQVVFDGQVGLAITPGEFTCTVATAVDNQGQPVSGITCAVTAVVVGS